jgi:dipeptide transport system permease protein
MIEGLSQDYVCTARAKGLREAVVVGGHAFRNALLPVATIVGQQVGTLLSCAILTETIFSWPVPNPANDLHPVERNEAAAR